MVNSELEGLEADMGNETEADGVPSYLQPDKEPDLVDELNLPPPPNGTPGQAQVSYHLLIILSLVVEEVIRGWSSLCSTLCFIKR